MGRREPVHAAAKGFLTAPQKFHKWLLQNSENEIESKRVWTLLLVFLV
jgi:hypothetical protein